MHAIQGTAVAMSQVVTHNPEMPAVMPSCGIQCCALGRCSWSCYIQALASPQQPVLSVAGDMGLHWRPGLASYLWAALSTRLRLQVLTMLVTWRLPGTPSFWPPPPG